MRIQRINSQIVRTVMIMALVAAGCILLGSGVSTFSYNTSGVILGALFILFCALYNIDWAVYVLIFAMLLSPELIVGKVPGRDIVIRIDDIVLILLSMIWFFRVAINKKLRLITPTPLNKTILLYVAVFCVCTGKALIAAEIHSLKGVFYIIKYLEYFVIFMLASNMVSNKKQLRTFLIIMILTFTIVNIFGITQLSTAKRITAPFEGAGEPNTLGGYQVLMLGILLGLFLHVRSVRIKIVLGAVILLAIIPFLNTLSRSSYMAVIAMYVSLIIFHKTKKVFLIGTLLLGIILSMFFLPQRVIDRIQYTFIPHPQKTFEPAKVFGVSLGPSASARIYSWKNVLKKWKEQPLMGYGLTGVGFIDGQYIRTLVELGIIGIFAFLLLLYGIFKHSLHIYKTTNDALYKGLALGFLAAHIGILSHALTANTYIIIRIMEPYWFLAAMVMAIPRLEVPQEEHKENKIQLDDKKHLRNSKFLINYSH